MVTHHNNFKSACNHEILLWVQKRSFPPSLPGPQPQGPAPSYSSSSTTRDVVTTSPPLKARIGVMLPHAWPSCLAVVHLQRVLIEIAVQKSESPSMPSQVSMVPESRPSSPHVICAHPSSSLQHTSSHHGFSLTPHTPSHFPYIYQWLLTI